MDRRFDGSNQDATYGISTGPLRAVPRGEHLRTRLGNSPEAFLIPDVMLWDPLFYFPELDLCCPVCTRKGLKEVLHPIRWKDGARSYDQPRQLYGLRNDALLVGRVYLCKRKHQILSHNPDILLQVKDEFRLPFVLFHKTGITRELFDFFVSHIRAGMTVADVQVLWQQGLFDEYGCRKLSYLKERKKDSMVKFPSFTPKGRGVSEKIATACYIHDYFSKEHLYKQIMTEMTACTLSADHTFKVSANIGLWCNRKWIKLYDSLFIVMNERGIVMSWKLCKGTSFNEVEHVLQSLKNRLSTQGCCINNFFIDNCCHWKAKLNAIFENALIQLDPFHAIQRVTAKIPKKGARDCPIRRLRAQLIRDFKLVLRDPTDRGKERTKSIASKEIIEKNIFNFLKQWKEVEYEGQKLMPQRAIDEVNKLLNHVRKGCLSEIPTSGGTNRNEGLHRFLNKTLKKSRLGVQFAIALLGVFFYVWNEKQMSKHSNKKGIKVIPPVESHFNAVPKDNANDDQYNQFKLLHSPILPGIEMETHLLQTLHLMRKRAVKMNLMKQQLC